MRIAICDDDVGFLKKIDSRVTRIFREAEIEVDIYSYSQANLVLENLYKGSFDLYFLDIDIGRADGIELANEIAKIDASAIFIFVTSHNNRVYEVFSLNTFGFVRKSDLDKDLDEVMKRLINKFGRIIYKYQIVKSDRTRMYIYIDELEYIERFGGRIVLGHINSEMIETSYRITSDLPFDLANFVECHKGVYINLRYAKKIGDDNIVTYSGKDLPMSRRKKKLVKEAFRNFMLDD